MNTTSGISVWSKITKITRIHRNTCSKRVQNSNKFIIEKIVRQFGYVPELSEMFTP
jgi:hypothetical protein